MTFKVGDQVKIFALKGSRLSKTYIGKRGKIIIVMATPNGSKQWCRVQFSENTFDYQDVGSWILE